MPRCLVIHQAYLWYFKNAIEVVYWFGEIHTCTHSPKRPASPNSLWSHCYLIYPSYQVSSNMHFSSPCIKTLFFFKFPFLSSVTFPHEPKELMFPHFTLSSQGPSAPSAILHWILFTKLHSYFKSQAKFHYSANVPLYFHWHLTCLLITL